MIKKYIENYDIDIDFPTINVRQIEGFFSSKTKRVRDKYKETQKKIDTII